MKLDMKQLMKQAEEMQKVMTKKQEELSKQTFEATSGGGMVTALVNGKHEVLNLKIDPTIVSTNDIDMLQDLVVAAVNEAFKKATDAASQMMSGMMGGLGGGLPMGF